MNGKEAIEMILRRRMSKNMQLAALMDVVVGHIVFTTRY